LHRDLGPKATARQIRVQEADYVLRVQAHHKGLHDRMQGLWAMDWTQDFTDCPHDYVDTVGKDHSRVANRRCWTTGEPPHVNPGHEWCDLVSMV
jgi:hypothetical protein